MANQKKDFFISYTGCDESWATWIAETLENVGYTVTIMAWDFRPGMLFPVEMDKAIKNTKQLVAVLSKAYCKAFQPKKEWAAFHAMKKVDNIIPVRIEDFKPKGLWGAPCYIDLVNKNEQDAKRELLKGVSKEGVPRTGSAFPGGGSNSAAAVESVARVPYPGKSTVTCGLPNRNPHFTGREEILKTIHQTFEKGELIARTQSLTGLGGIGKSQIAAEYAYRYAKDYTHIAWVNAENDGTIYASLEAFALGNGIVNKKAKYESAELLNAVRNWLSENDNWLFIFDNASEERSLMNYLPQDTDHRRHVLITSRYKNWRSIATPLTVEVFSKEEASEFLTKRTSKPRDAFQDRLAEQLGYLSLALGQAAAYICNNADCDYRAYLSLLETYHLEVLKASSRTKQSVHATWDISIQKITDKSAIQLLNLCAFFAPDRIDLSWFVKASDCLPQPLRDTLPNELHFNSAKAELANYSLVEIRNGKISLHRLLQEVVKDSLKAEQNVWLDYCVLILNKCMYSDFSTPESRVLFTELAPHLHSVAAQIPPEAQTAEIANLHFFLGYGYYQFADYSQALEWHRKALAIREKVLGAAHPDTATTYNNIAMVYRNQGKYEQALEWYAKALPVCVKVLGLNHPKTKTVINNMEIAYKNSGNPKPFEEWMEEVISKG
jgi:tetratricopeptide (TPR) repeat protein